MSPGRPDSAPGDLGLETAAPVFAALGDETRLRLVARLSTRGPLSITRLTAGGGVTRQAVTKHLAVLAQVGLARSSQLGRERIWELQPQPLLTARACLEQVSAQWDEALGRLRQLVEDEPGPDSSPPP
jgi:DNA-binding transcriptional ArsR family regulator